MRNLSVTRKKIIGLDRDACERYAASPGAVGGMLCV